MPQKNKRLAGLRGIPEGLSQRMYDVLKLTAQRLFPDGIDTHNVVKRHSWRNQRYVGKTEHGIQEWLGWSINLRTLKAGNSTLYADYCKNELTLSENTELYGVEFATAVDGVGAFIFIFVTSCTSEVSDVFSAGGFLFRRINQIIHPGILVSYEDFMEVSPNLWLRRVIELLKVQQRVCQL